MIFGFDDERRDARPTSASEPGRGMGVSVGNSGGVGVNRRIISDVARPLAELRNLDSVATEERSAPRSLTPSNTPSRRALRSAKVTEPAGVWC